MRKLFLLFTAVMLSLVSVKAEQKVTFKLHRSSLPFNGSVWNTPATSGDVTLTPSPQVNYVTGSNYILPAGGSYTFSVPEGKQITQINFVRSNPSNSINLEIVRGEGQYEEPTWTGNAQLVELKAKEDVSLYGDTLITVTYEEVGPTVVGTGTKDDPFVVSTLSEITEIDKYYKCEGEYIVTYRDINTNAPAYYVQDATGDAIKIEPVESMSASEFLNPYRTGDKIPVLYLINKGDKVCEMHASVQPSSYDNTVAAQVLTLQDLANAEMKYRYVKVESVSSADAGQTFAAATTFGMTQKGYTAENALGCFVVLDTPTPQDVEGHTVPQYMNVAGILDGTVLRPRFWQDITELEAPADPKAVVTLEKSETAPVKINEKTAVATFKVEVENLTEDGKITFEGDNASIFSAEPAAVTNETTEVVVYATATAIGVFEGKVSFDFGSEELNKDMTFDLKVSAYDPENLPTVTLSESSLSFSAETRSEEKTITLTMVNCFAPVKIHCDKAMSNSHPFTVSPSTIEPTEEPVEITVEFHRISDDEYTAEYEITTEMMAEPVVLTLVGAGLTFVEMITADADGMYRVYSVNGVKVMETSNADDLNGLAAGIYVINGRKYMINK